MQYAVKYDVRIPDDLKSIDTPFKKRIRGVIEVKLTAQPELFGKPLRNSLAGFRVLRVGRYRVVYLIEQSAVLVLLIGDRKYV